VFECSVDLAGDVAFEDASDFFAGVVPPIFRTLD
jgi:hypothetical protein